jgi:uncharacterized protein (TIGR03437 family)
VTVGGAAAAVQFSGLASGFVGLLQINIQLPAVLPAGVGTPPGLNLTLKVPDGVSVLVNLWTSR